MVNNENFENREQYKLKILSNKFHEINITMDIYKTKLRFQSSYTDNYFEIKHSKEYSLEELKTKLDYFKQFKEEKQLLEEIRNNSLKGQEKVIEDESKDIKLIIPLPCISFKSIEFVLNKIEKTNEEILKEYKSIVNIYLKKLQISELNSKIIIEIEHKERIKNWINPFDELKANLLYSFYISYTKEEKKQDKKIEATVKEFHDKCDNKPSILVLCKSGKQIFGGYTPLKFTSKNEYGNDEDSFLFSINQLEKYSKSSGHSIWCYKDYGPCFNYDLEFVVNKMNEINIYSYSYKIPSNFLNKNDDCLKDKDCSHIFLDSLEIFEIVKIKNKKKK